MLWILAPVIATLSATLIVQNFIPPEKKIAERVPRLYGTSDLQFVRVMDHLLGPAIMQGNRVDVLLNGEEIFPAMLTAIRSARHTITFETFIYWSGGIGETFADALAERARAGVKVHVLLDWVGSLKMEAHALDAMREAGVQIEKYHPLNWYYLARANNRTHRKLLVVDGRVGFTGGVGIADLWQGRAEDPAHWRDMHFRVEGPAVAHLQATVSRQLDQGAGRGTARTGLLPGADAGGRHRRPSVRQFARRWRGKHAPHVPAGDQHADGRAEAGRARAHHRAGTAYGRRNRPPRVARRLGRPAGGRRGDLRVRAHHVPLQGLDRGWLSGLGRVDELRYAIVPAERRGESQHLRPAFRGADDGRFRNRPGARAAHQP